MTPPSSPVGTTPETCQQAMCEKPATTEVFWPGQTTRQCDEHAEKVVRLGAFMGCVVDTRPLAAKDGAP